MIKCFLSHSGKDKNHYVDIVAQNLEKMHCIYDAISFEEGTITIDEIERQLNEATLFVIFLSNNSLESKFVKEELKQAKQLLHNDKLQKIFPIIIDPSINYKDNRIPRWIKDEYNLKLISRPSQAARRIRQQMIEISWQIHPRIADKSKIFVGRNELIKKLEERVDSLDMLSTVCLIASGLRSIGRKTLLKRFLIKSNITTEFYDPPIINLSSRESIEDFILKVYDLGFSQDLSFVNLLQLPMKEKIELSHKLIMDTHQAREVLFIIDEGCIVTLERELSCWFTDIIKSISPNEGLVLCIASQFRPNFQSYRSYESLFHIEVPELSKTERQGLLKRYAEFEKLVLSYDEYKYFAELQSGFPEQIYFTVQLIRELGLDQAKKESHIIADYNTEKIIKILKDYEDNEPAKNFLYFLSQFEFISYNLIYEIVGDDENYDQWLKEFIGLAICEHLGANKEYLRINDAVRDYISRNRLDLPHEFKDKLKSHVKQFLETYKSEDKDVSDIFYSLKEALITGEDFDERYLVPSHFLRTMKELYDLQKKYQDVIQLADRVLENEAFLDTDIARGIRYYLCLSLARIKDGRLLSEVQKLREVDRNFILGFYYRLTGRHIEAIEKLTLTLKKAKNLSGAKRELVQVYMNIGEYEKALILAKQNYENDKSNAFHINAYFRCLIRASYVPGNDQILVDLLNRLSKIKMYIAEEMYLRLDAQYHAYYKNNSEVALSLIEQAISTFPDSIYAKIEKAELCIKFNMDEEAKNELKNLDRIVEKKSYHYGAIIYLKATCYAKSGDIKRALALINNELIYYPADSIKRYEDNIKRLARTRI